MNLPNENLSHSQDPDGQEVFDYLVNSLGLIPKPSGYYEPMFVAWWNLDETEKKDHKNTDVLISQKIFCSPGTVKVYFPQLCKQIKELLKKYDMEVKKVDRHNLKMLVLRLIRHRLNTDYFMSFLDEDNKKNVEYLFQKMNQSDIDKFNQSIRSHFHTD